MLHPIWRSVRAAAAHRHGSARHGKFPRRCPRETLERSVKSWGGLDRGESVEDYLESIRAEDLALAIACRANVAAAGKLSSRSIARAVCLGARDLPRGGCSARDRRFDVGRAVRRRCEGRASIAHCSTTSTGAASLATWLRAIVAQRHIDSVRGARRFEPLDDAAPPDSRTTNESADPPRAGSCADDGNFRGSAERRDRRAVRARIVCASAIIIAMN